jgi:phosphatidylglycerophosphate synthase
MTKLAALVFDEEAPITLGGMTLTERAVSLAKRVGLEPVLVSEAGTAPPVPSAWLNSRVVVVGSNVLFGPTLLTALAEASEDLKTGEAVAASESGAPLLICLPAESLAVLDHATIEAMAAALAARGLLREMPMAGLFGRRVTSADDIAAVERAYIRHLTGKGESYFTKKIRRFSVPLTTRLVHLGARPTHVTLGGLLLAITSAWFMARGSYAAGVLGALLYYISMIFDCSDGEVARVTLREGPFGAWLETIVDYITYFLILAAIAIASQLRPQAEAYRLAAVIALVGSVIVMLVAGYLRHRVAAADPGQFDDASAKALATASGFHRFARWGRQWIKRSTVAHLVVFLAVIGQLPVILYLWAFGATVAAFVFLAVEPFVVRRVAVAPAGARNGGGG